MNRKYMLVGLILISSLAVTLLSFFYKQNLSTIGMTKTGHGFPLSWYMKSQIVYPDSPVVASIIWVNFFLDIFMWYIIIAIPTIILIQRRKITV